MWLNMAEKIGESGGKKSLTLDLPQGVQHRWVLVVIFFPIFEIIFVCFVVAVCDPVHDVETIHGLCLLIAYRNIH